jgi:hypothetical protein
VVGAVNDYALIGLLRVEDGADDEALAVLALGRLAGEEVDSREQ